MRTRTCAAIAALLATLTACSGGGTDAKPTATKSPTPSRTASPTRTPTPSPSGSAAAMSLGKGVETVGAGGKGALEITPTTVLYVKEAMGSTSANGVFAIVTVKDRATNAVAAAESALIEGGGWQWIAPDGEAIGVDNGEAAGVTPEGFLGGGEVQPGSFQWKAVAFDLSTAQRGGTLAYTDGNHKTYRWKMPSSDKGPELARLKKGMEGNY